MNLLTRMFRKPTSETAQKKAAVDKAYARFMQEIRGFAEYWHDIWEPDYRAQPLKIDHEAKQWDS